MIYLGKKAGSIEEGVEISKEMISSGKAFDKFLEIVKMQNGDTTILKDLSKYPKSKYSEIIVANKTGYFKSVNNYDIGMSALELGAGRLTKEDKIDPKAGIIFYHKIGDRIKKGDVIAELFTDKKNKIESVKERVTKSLAFSSKKTSRPKLIKKIIS